MSRAKRLAAAIGIPGSDRVVAAADVPEDVRHGLAFLRQGDSLAEAAETAGVPAGQLRTAERERGSRHKSLPESSAGIQRLRPGRSYGAVDRQELAAAIEAACQEDA